MKRLANPVPKRGKSAFTLIELLVVIAIIAILAAILFPVFAKAREKARQASCLSNTKQMANAIAMFTQDHDETLPKGFFNDEEAPGVTWGMPWDTGWDGAIYPYMKNVQILQCPSDPVRRTYTAPNNPQHPLYGKGPIPTSYRYNTSNFENGVWTALPLSHLDSPAQCIQIAESVPGVNDANYNDLNTAEGSNDMSFVCNNKTGGGGVYTNNVGFDRHSPIAGRSNVTYNKPGENLPGSDAGMSNYVFADGHAKAMSWGSTWQRIGPDKTTVDGKQVTPTMWRQNFNALYTDAGSLAREKCLMRLP